MCDFCNAMKKNRFFDRIAQQNALDGSCRYSVAIVSRIFIKGRRGCQGRSTDYRNRGCGYVLNYCPECGRKMYGGASDGE